MRHVKHGLLVVGLLAAIFCLVNSGQIAEGRSAVIRLNGDAYHVTYYESGYRLRPFPDYPTVHYHFHDVRARGAFRHHWRSVSDINYPFR